MKKLNDPFERAIRILTGREHSQYQLKTKLITRGFVEEDVDLAIIKLVDLNYLDDLRFARLLVRDRTHIRLRGFADARLKLYQAGVDENLQAQAIKEGREEYNELEICIKAATKRAKNINESDEFKFRVKLSRHLAGRGFPVEIIKKSISKIKLPLSPDKEY